MSQLNLTFLFLLLVFRLAAQVPKTDSSFVQVARNQAVAAYAHAVNKQAHLFEGNEYIPHDHRISVHPFYKVDSLLVGTVQYNDTQYTQVKLLYDIVRHELAVQPPEGGYRVRLRNEHVTAFSMGPYRFTRIVGDSATGVVTGFYEVLHEGATSALAYRAKVVVEDVSQGFYKAQYNQKDRFFLVKNGAYHEVKSKKSFLSLFPDQSKTLRKFMRTNSLKFKDTLREEAISRLMRYAETL